VHFRSSASAAAAATLAASVNYPLRGAVTFKAPVGQRRHPMRWQSRPAV
jgi:indolepyruvate ferredoxin oxidoreductase alpha subunit